MDNFQVTGVTSFILNSGSTNHSLVTLTNNLSAVVRTERRNGKEYLVAPVTMIVPGVLHGSKGALYYPKEEVARNVRAWNRVPLTLGHPNDDLGRAASARQPGIVERFGLGHVANAVFRKGKLMAEAWFDRAKVASIAPTILNKLRNSLPIELSTGLFTENHPVRNGIYNGRPYSYVARNYRPDHLAILLTEKGACSLGDGCGVLINSRHNESSPLSNFVVTE